jgi:ribokinase
MSQPITVVGSLNMDFVVQVAAFPLPGETVFGTGFRTIPGGKGGNQACAAATLGGRVRMVGRIGDDAVGEQLRASLEAAGVDTRDVLASPATSSGAAVIVVQAGGQNQIVVASGANALLSPADVSRALEGLPGGFLLLQLETPLETVEAAAAIAHRLGAAVVLDPAPARPLPDALLAHVSCLTPNESEAMILLGRREGTVTLAEAPDVARALRGRGARAVLLKLGEKGAFLDDGRETTHFPAPQVEAVDATAAGDTFNGALVVALGEGRPMADAVRFANAAAALSVTRVGAQASIPTRGEVETLLGW